MSGLLFIPGIEQADLADEATVQAALASALWFPGSPTSICGIEEPGLLFALSASTALNPYPLALFSDDQDGALWRGTLASSVERQGASWGLFEQATPGDVVGRIKDQSENSLNLIQYSTSLRPKFGSRPVVGIRNLLIYTEDFSNAAWAKLGLTPTATTGPGGASGAWTLTCDAGAGAKHVGQTPTRTAGQAETITYTLRANTHPFVQILDAGDGQAFCNIDLSTGLAGTKGTKATVAIENLGDDWYRCAVTFNATTVKGAARLYFVASSTMGYGSSFTAVGTETVDVYQPQVEDGDEASAYQAVVSAQDVSEAGVESVSYLLFDLYDDALSSAAFPDGLTGQAFVAGDGGCYVTDVTLAPAGTFSIGGTSHNWTGATPGILRAVTGNTGRVLDMAVREGDFTETELDRLVRKYRALGGKGLLVPTGANLFANGAFASDISGVTNPAPTRSTLTWDAGELKMDATAGDGVPPPAAFAITAAAYTPYLVEWDARTTDGATTTGIIFGPFSYSGGLSVAASRKAVVFTTGVVSTFSLYGSVAKTVFFDNVSVRRMIPEEEL